MFLFLQDIAFAYNLHIASYNTIYSNNFFTH